MSYHVKTVFRLDSAGEWAAGVPSPLFSGVWFSRSITFGNPFKPEVFRASAHQVRHYLTPQ
jgi:hypothetical protein